MNQLRQGEIKPWNYFRPFKQPEHYNEDEIQTSYIFNRIRQFYDIMKYFWQINSKSNLCLPLLKIDAKNTAVDTIYQKKKERKKEICLLHVLYIRWRRKTDKQVKYSMLNCGKYYRTKLGKEDRQGLPE